MLGSAKGSTAVKLSTLHLQTGFPLVSYSFLNRLLLFYFYLWGGVKVSANRLLCGQVYH